MGAAIRIRLIAGVATLAGAVVLSPANVWLYRHTSYDPAREPLMRVLWTVVLWWPAVVAVVCAVSIRPLWRVGGRVRSVGVTVFALALATSLTTDIVLLRALQDLIAHLPR
jgi:hypothetical protein